VVNSIGSVYNTIKEITVSEKVKALRKDTNELKEEKK